MSIQPQDHQGGEYREYRKRVVDDALSKIKFKPKGPTTPQEVVMKKAMDITSAMSSSIASIVAAGGARTHDDRLALRDLIMTFYLEAFNSKLFSKDELCDLLAILHTDLAMEIIEADPAGGGKPDLLSGFDLPGENPKP